MSRIFARQVPILVRQKIPRVQSLGATAVIETLEDICQLRKRDKSVEELFTHCISRALALLPELRMCGLVRALFAYKKAGIASHSFLNEVSTFIVEECMSGKPFENFLETCTANDVLLLYKAFAVNGHLNVQLYSKLTDIIEDQIMHMIPSDCCVFFQSHIKYIELCKSHNYNGEEEAITVEKLSKPSVAQKVTMRFLQQSVHAIPEDVTIFMEWLAANSEHYDIISVMQKEIYSFCKRLAGNPVIFNIDHINRVVQSLCIIHPYTAEEYLDVSRWFIFSLLQEAERRSDVQDYQRALETFYKLESIGFWEFNVMQGLIYSIVNNVNSIKELSKVLSILKNRTGSCSTDIDSGQRKSFHFVIDTLTTTAQRIKLKELIQQLESRCTYITS